MAIEDPADLIDVQGMMRAYGISRSRVYQWIRDDDFPEPLDAPFIKDRVWSRKQVEAWTNRPRRTGGRSKVWTI